MNRQQKESAIADFSKLLDFRKTSTEIESLNRWMNVNLKVLNTKGKLLVNNSGFPHSITWTEFGI